MKNKIIVFTKPVSYQNLTNEINLIHQLGFYVEVESIDDYMGMANTSYEIRAVSWCKAEEVEE